MRKSNRYPFGSYLIILGNDEEEKRNGFDI